MLSANEISRRGTKRSLLKRRAQTLQNWRLVQKCQRKRTSLLPHSQQKFGLYTARFSALSFECLVRAAGDETVLVRRNYMPAAAIAIGFRFGFGSDNFSQRQPGVGHFDITEQG